MAVFKEVLHRFEEPNFDVLMKLLAPTESIFRSYQFGEEVEARVVGVHEWKDIHLGVM